MEHGADRKVTGREKGFSPRPGTFLLSHVVLFPPSFKSSCRDLWYFCETFVSSDCCSTVKVTEFTVHPIWMIKYQTPHDSHLLTISVCQLIFTLLRRLCLYHRQGLSFHDTIYALSNDTIYYFFRKCQTCYTLSYLTFCNLVLTCWNAFSLSAQNHKSL